MFVQLDICGERENFPYSIEIYFGRAECQYFFTEILYTVHMRETGRLCLMVKARF